MILLSSAMVNTSSSRRSAPYSPFQLCMSCDMNAVDASKFHGLGGAGTGKPFQLDSLALGHREKIPFSVCSASESSWAYQHMPLSLK